MNRRKLAEEITRILVLSNCAEKWGGRGETAEEIESFEHRAFDAYLGNCLLSEKTTENLMVDGHTPTPSKVIFNRLFCRVQRDVALILSAIDEYKKTILDQYNEEILKQMRAFREEANQ